MKNLLEKKFLLFFKRYTIFFATIILFATISLLGKVSIVKPTKNTIKLSEFISGLSTMNLAHIYTSGTISRKDLPKFLNISGEKNLLCFTNKKNILIIDILKREVGNLLNFKDISSIFKVSELDGHFIVHKINDKLTLSNVDIKSGKVFWAIPHNFTSRYFSTRYIKIENTSHLIMYGLYRKKIGKKSIFMNKILILDSKNGNTIEEKHFHYRRNIKNADNNIELFVERDKKDYEVINLNSGEVVLKGKYDDNDIPDKKNRYWFIDEYRLPSSYTFKGRYRSY